MSAEIDIIQLRARVAELEQKVEFLYKKLGMEFSADPPRIDPRIVDNIKKGNLIEAIKTYREIHDVGLAEAKAAVENIQRSLL